MAMLPIAQMPMLLSHAASPTSQPIVVVQSDQSNPLDAFTRTKIFQLAEGKQTTNLHEMLRPEFWIDTIKELVIASLAFIPRLLVSILFLFIFWLIYRFCRRMLGAAMQRANVDPSIRDMLLSLTKWTIMGFGLMIACNQIGIPIVAMLTGVSILGLAVGFAAQETLANFIAGIVIFWDKPFKAGDWLTLETVYAQVQRITFRSCRLLDLDGQTVIFPNTAMLSNKVINHSTHPRSRLTVTIGIAYGEPIDAARKVLIATTIGDLRIGQHPAPEVVVKNCADSSVELSLRFWIEDDKLERQMSYEYMEKAKLALDVANIEIPFPHVQLLLNKTSLDVPH